MLITGGGRGIGAATARLAAQRGYAVCVNYLRNRDAADKLVGEIEKSGGRAQAVAGDVAREADVIRMKHFEDLTFEEIGTRLGNSINTVKTRYYRGISRLLDRLGSSFRGGAE
jgi:NAD(P)-dependent dehydrogenase (short-subunit alcohol dehydrogenase family)